MRIIAHLDMDAFFASVEERDNPRFTGKPIVVGSDPKGGFGRGVVSTANYKAREYGIRSALPISKAWQFSELAKRQGKPPVIFITPNFEKYRKASDAVLKITREHSPLVEPASIDEAYLQLNPKHEILNSKEAWESAIETVKNIKAEIFDKEKLTCSVGIGPNKLIAKIASDMNKPNGLTIVHENEIEKFLEPLSVRKIPGIGPKTEEELNRLGIKTIKDLLELTGARLHDLFGKWGVGIYEKARGIDESPVSEEYEAKSIGEQETFEHDTIDAVFINSRLDAICKSVFKRFGNSGFKTFRTIAITARFADFETKTRAHTIPSPDNKFVTIVFEAAKLLTPFLDKRENPKKKLIRLIGVRIEKLE